MHRCQFVDYAGRQCDRSPPDVSGPIAHAPSRFCSDHLGIKCSGCSKQAERQCTMLSMQGDYCGHPLCKTCVHDGDEHRRTYRRRGLAEIQREERETAVSDLAELLRELE